MTGIILAGGNSIRFNKINKALLKVGNETIIENIITKLKIIFDEILIVTNERGLFNQLTNHHLTKIVKDIIPNKGSLGGIYSGIINSKNKYNFIVACDMPFLNIELIKYIINNVSDDFDIIIPKLNKGYETLHAIYSKNCIEYIQEQLTKNNLKIINFFSKVKVKIINENDIKQFDKQLLSFFNINTEVDYKQALSLVK